MRIRFFSLFLLLLAALMLASCATAPRFRFQTDETIAAILQKAPAYPDAAFVVLSDPHFFDLSLGAEGAAFESYLDEDRKLIRESGELLDQAARIIAETPAEFLVIPGDLTKDGELSAHREVAQRLEGIEEAGIQVYVICGNHDVLNPEAYRYEGDEKHRVQNISPQDFATIYARFGYEEALERDPGSLSYIVEPKPGLWLLALDSCIYTETTKEGRSITEGRFSPATLSWIEQNLLSAARQGKAVLAFMHHGITEHYPSQAKHYGEYIVEDSGIVSRLLAAYHVRIVFTGHYHAQDVTRLKWEDSRFLYDVETGSLVTYPCPLRLLAIQGNRVSLQSRRVERIESREEGFQDFARQYLLAGISGIAVKTMLELKVADKDARYIAPQVAQAFAAHYAGDERPEGPILETKGVGFMGRIVIGNRRSLVQGLWQDLEPPDDNLSIDLADGSWQRID